MSSERQHARRPTPAVEQPAAPKKDIKADFERKQREAMEKLSKKAASPHLRWPRPWSRCPLVHPPTWSVEKHVVQSDEDRLAELEEKIRSHQAKRITD